MPQVEAQDLWQSWRKPDIEPRRLFCGIEHSTQAEVRPTHAALSCAGALRFTLGAASISTSRRIGIERIPTGWAPVKC
jgi:hypothetical protein